MAWQETSDCLLSIVHPNLYASRLNATVRELQRTRALKEALAAGGSFVVTPTPNGQINIRKT